MRTCEVTARLTILLVALLQVEVVEAVLPPPVEPENMWKFKPQKDPVNEHSIAQLNSLDVRYTHHISSYVVLFCHASCHFMTLCITMPCISHIAGGIRCYGRDRRERLVTMCYNLGQYRTIKGRHSPCTSESNQTISCH